RDPGAAAQPGTAGVLGVLDQQVVRALTTVVPGAQPTLGADPVQNKIVRRRTAITTTVTAKLEHPINQHRLPRRLPKRHRRRPRPRIKQHLLRPIPPPRTQTRTPRPRQQIRPPQTRTRPRNIPPHTRPIITNRRHANGTGVTRSTLGRAWRRRS